MSEDPVEDLVPKVAAEERVPGWLQLGSASDDPAEEQVPKLPVGEQDPELAADELDITTIP